MSEQPEKKVKREYRKGDPLTKTEYNTRYESIKTRTHKLVRVYVPYAIADDFKKVCKDVGVTQQEAISVAMLDYLEKVKKLK